MASLDTLNINHQDVEGNTFLHHCLLRRVSFKDLEHLIQKSDLTLRNNLGQSAFHFAAKHYFFISKAIDLLLKYGANVNEIDNLGSSVLHEALKNFFVNQKVIEKLLKNGAYPDYRDQNGKPPLAYCEASGEYYFLQSNEIQATEKMLIQYSVLKKASLIQSDFSLEESGDAVVCFHFCEDNNKRVEWIGFRDSCIVELSEMGKVNLELNYTLRQFLVDYSYNTEKSLNLFNLKTILCEVQKNKYPVYREMLIFAIKKYDFEPIIRDLFSLHLELVSTSEFVEILNLDCIHKMFEFLHKTDVINFILAFYKF